MKKSRVCHLKGHSSRKLSRRRLKNKRKRTRKQNGGGFIPDDLLNVGRQMHYNNDLAYNNLYGLDNTAVNPMPWLDQMNNSSRYAML